MLSTTSSPISDAFPPVNIPFQSNPSFDVESAASTSLDGSYGRSSAEMPKDVPLGRPDSNYAGNGMHKPYPRSSLISTCQRDEESTVTGTTPWYRRSLTCLTMYGELSAAHVAEDFAPVRMRLQQEWVFDAGFLVALSAADAAMFAITPGSIFELNSHAYTAIAASSTACGLGIACNMWFLLRYSWVDLETFVYRARDIYDSYVFFSLSSRMPTFCMLLSSVSLMAFLGFIACDAWPVGVLVIGILVAFVMILQFIVYGMHQSVTSALRVWRAGMVFIIQGFRCLGSG